MSIFKKKNQKPDPLLSAIDDLMTFSAQSLEVSREESRVASERLALLEKLVADYGAALTAEKDANKATADRIDLIEQRLVSMGNELSHQLHELSDEIERLGAQAPDGDSAPFVDALKSAQAKLAQEQARYAIAFRQDLAALADQVRKRLG